MAHLAQVGPDLIVVGLELLLVDKLGKVEQAVARLAVEIVDVPLALVMSQCFYIFFHPFLDRGARGSAQVVQEDAQGLAGGIFLVELHIVVEVAVQLVGKVAHDTLKKRVDGAHVEVGVAMQNALQGTFCMVLYLLLAIAVDFDVVVEILSLAFRELVELGHDALLHLVGSLVGKGDGQHVLVIVAAAGAQLRAACLGVFRPQ